MRDRPLALDKYSIDRDAYYELKYFCRQYFTFKRELEDLTLLRSCLPSPEIGNDGKAGFMPISAGATSDPTIRAVLWREKLLEKMRMIEQSAIETDAALYPYILSSVTTRKTFDEVAPPCGRNQFYQARRKFFYLLYLRKNGYTGDVES